MNDRRRRIAAELLERSRAHADQVADVTALIEAEPSVLTSVVPVGAGMRLVVKRR